MAIVMIAIFSAIGLFFTGMGLWGIFAEIRRVYRIRVWPRVMGYILASQVTESDTDGPSYNVHVEYQYKILGYPYTGSADIMGIQANEREKAADICRSYPVGLELQIAYNPARPAQSEIADDAQRSIKPGVILFGLVCTGFSIFWTYQITGGFGSQWGEP